MALALGMCLIDRDRWIQAHGLTIVLLQSNSSASSSYLHTETDGKSRKPTIVTHAHATRILFDRHATCGRIFACGVEYVHTAENGIKTTRVWIYFLAQVACSFLLLVCHSLKLDGHLGNFAASVCAQRSNSSSWNCWFCTIVTVVWHRTSVSNGKVFHTTRTVCRVRSCIRS
jgi:hypothetical protein